MSSFLAAQQVRPRTTKRVPVLNENKENEKLKVFDENLGVKSKTAQTLGEVKKTAKVRAPLKQITTSKPLVVQQKSKAKDTNTKSSKMSKNESMEELASQVDAMDIDTSLPTLVAPLAVPQPALLPLPFVEVSSAMSFDDPINSSKDVEDIDMYDRDDPLFCTEYEKCMIDANYMDRQPEITKKHRMILVNWMSEVCGKFRLTSETFFLAVQLLDRYLALKPTSKERIQLVGVTSMMIASKCEEIYSPEVKDWVWMTADAYSKEEILKMEKSILLALDFNLTVPNPLHFLRRYSKAAKSDSEIHTLSKYLCEISQLDYAILHFAPSLIAASAVYLARASVWDRTLEHYSGFSEQELKNCSHALKQVQLSQKREMTHNSIFRKYASEKLFSVAKKDLI